MNQLRRLVLIGATLVSSGCATIPSKEQEMTPTPEPDYTALASAICGQFSQHLKDEGKITDSRVVEQVKVDCTSQLAKTAAYHGGIITGDEYDPGSKQMVSRAEVYAISIAGNLMVPADALDADYLAQLIERTR